VIAVKTLAVGFVALLAIFKIRSFKEAIRLGQAEREAEKAQRASAAAEQA